MTVRQRLRTGLDLCRVSGELEAVSHAVAELNQHLRTHGSDYRASARGTGSMRVSLYSSQARQTLIFGEKGFVTDGIGSLDAFVDYVLLEALSRPLEDERPKTVLQMISRLYTAEESPAVVQRIYDLLNGSGYIQPIISGGMVRLDLHLNASGGAGFHFMSTEGTVVIYDKSKSEHATILDEEAAEAIFGQLVRR